MRIRNIETIEFTYESHHAFDEKGHAHPGDPHEATGAITRIAVEGGPDGYCVGGSREANTVAADHLVGENPLDREALWHQLYRTQRLNRGTLTDHALGVLDSALYDVAGKAADVPVFRLLGGARDSVPAYASTMVGDDDPDGLGSPEAYADFAADLVDRGFEAIKLHGWMPPYSADPDRDLAACRAVRERVGPDIDLMLDAFHYYSRMEAKRLGEGLAELDYEWFEEPMDEHSMSSYEWLTAELEIPVIGPETAEGKMQTRAEWLKRNIADIGRVGVFDVGGITPAKKTTNLYEAFGVECEVHGCDLPNLHLLCSMPTPGRYFEYGLLHPKYDYESWAHPWLNSHPSPDADGVIHVPDEPGLGYDIDWSFVDAHRID